MRDYRCLIWLHGSDELADRLGAEVLGHRRRGQGTRHSFEGAVENPTEPIAEPEKASIDIVADQCIELGLPSQHAATVRCDALHGAERSKGEGLDVEESADLVLDGSCERTSCRLLQYVLMVG